MSSTCNASVDLCAIRVSKLTAAGAPLTGANNGYVTKAAIKLDIGVEVETGDEKTQKNGCGELLATLKDVDTIKGLTLAMDLIHLDAYLNEFLTGSDTFESGGNAIGFQFAAVGSTPSAVCVEGWSKAWQVDHQLVAPFTSPLATYIHWVFPNTQWVQGQLTAEHDIMVVPVSGTGKENSKITANGPFDDWPVAVAARGGVTRIGGWFFDSSIPTPTCLKIPVTSAAS